MARGDKESNGHLGKTLLVKDKFLSKITFTKTPPASTQQHQPEVQKMSTGVIKQSEKNPVLHLPVDGVYEVYPQRWWLLATVVLLNLANYSHWVAFPSVAKNAAKYYDQTGERMDLIPTVSYGLGIPCCLLATYVVERLGLKTGLHIGGSLTGIGGLMCFLSTFPYLSDGMSSDAKFYLALVGQALTGIACPFISCVPTKISQHWFGDNQRTMATLLLGMSNPMGIVLGQGLTPLLVQEESDVPIMNIVWFIPAGLGAILTMWKVTANRPPTPPSPSAAMAIHRRATRGREYWPNIKRLFTNWPFIVMFLFVGGAMGYVSTISTKIEQILCSRGYTDQLSGLSGSLILLCGFLASFPFGLIAHKTGKYTLLCKLSGFIVITSLVMIGYFMRVPDQGVAIVFSCVLLGIFALGPYPLALELIVECTYPIDQAIGTAFIFLSSALQGVFLMEIENYMGNPLTSEEDLKIQSCVAEGDSGHQQPKDYSSYLNFITGYMLVLSVLFMLCFSTVMHRTNADEDTKRSVANTDAKIVKCEEAQEALVPSTSEETNTTSTCVA